MRKIYFLLTLIVILPLFSLSVSAEGRVDKYIGEFENILPEQLRDTAKDPEKLTDSLGLESLLAALAEAISGESGRVAKFFASLLGITVLMSVPLTSNENIASAVRCGVGVVGSVLIFSLLSGAICEISASLEEISSFFASLIPVAVGVSALGGAVATASVQAVGMYTTVSLVGRSASAVMLPLVGFGFATSMLTSLGSDHVGAISKGIKSVFGWLIGIMTALIGGTLSLQTMISAAQDSAAMRTARYMASGLIPVVGSTVSGALSTLASGISYAKGVIGAGAIAAIISIAVAPLVSLLLYRFALSGASMIATMLGAREADGIFTSFRFSLDALTALYALSSIIYILEIIIFAKAGEGIV